MAAGDRNDNPYDDAGGFGKFRKHPNRKQHSTPYDRPPTAVRNPSLAATTNNANGWLSKLVDPAQRLITSGAHKLFASVFRKRLPPPPTPQLPESEANFGASNSQEAVRKDSHGIPESSVDRIDSPATSSDRDGLTEVEFMLKQKTFTKSEIARLTDLLQSRTVDFSVGTREKISEVIPSKSVLSRERKEVAITPIKDDRLERNGVSTPITSSSVLDEDVATPAELAKAYMGSRPSEVSPQVLGLRGRAIGEDSVAQFSQPFPLKSPILSVAPRSSVHSLATENGFMTPRSRGRSAIYNMARTPYSRLRLTSTHQGTRRETDVLGAPSSSSSQSIRESGFSGSKQGVLKRRSSVFDSDIGSVGPIRRIRQKSNLLPSSGTLSIRGTGIVSDGGRRPSSSQKEAFIRETKTENGDMTHASGTSSVPSKSREVASQILQQLDVLVSCRDKSPTKISPSGLRGQALRSLENLESSKFLETVQDDKKLDITPGVSLSDTQKPVSQKEDNCKGSTVKLLTSNEKFASLSNGVDPPKLLKTNPSDVKSTSPPGLISVAQTPPQKKRAFQMSAHEDFLELDDDDHYEETTSATLSTEKAAKVGGAVADNKNTSVETSVFEKGDATSKGKIQSISMLNQNSPRSSDGITVSDKNTAVTVTAASFSGISSKEAVVDCQATVTSKKASPPKELNADAPFFSNATKAVSMKEPNGFPPVDFNSKPPVAVSTLPVVTGPVGTMFGASLDNKLDNSSSTMKPLSKEPESDKADGKNNLKATETVSAAAATWSPSTTSIFSFTGMPASASTTNGSIPIPSVSFADTPKLSNTVFGQSSSSGSSIAVATTTTTATNSNGISNPSSISTSTSSFISGSVFPFGSSSTSTLSTSAATVVEPAKSEKKETSFTNPSSSPFGTSLSPGGSLFSGFSSSAAATNPSSGGLFSFNAGGNTLAAAASNNQSGSVNPFSAPKASATGAIFGTSSPISFGSSTSAPSFGLTPSSTALPSGSSLFSSTTGSTFGLTSSTSAANPVSSTPAFGSPSTGFTFGASSSASGATTNAPSVQVFNFNSAATTTPSLPMFGSKSNPPAFAFGSSSPGNNDQMNMEDSMAEDTIQATTSTAPLVFGQQPASTAFVFGSAAPAGGNLFPTASPSGENNNNPFQFGSQSNQPPFQASGSLEFNAGGSFSLGTGDKSGRRFVKVKKNRKK